MKKIFLSLMGALLLATAAEAAPKVTFDPIQVQTKVGESLTFNLFGLDFDVPTTGSELDLKFNPDVLQVKNVTFPKLLNRYGKEIEFWSWKTDYYIDNENGYINELTFWENEGPMGDFPIATVEFDVIKNGRSFLTLAPTNSGFGSEFGDENGIIQGVEYDAAQVTVPEPATMTLLLAGLGMIGYKKTKK